MRSLDQPKSDEGFDEIDEAECWRLLAGQPVGRFAVVLDGYPIVFPVNYSLLAHGVVFRTARGAKLWSTNQSNVSFEVDEIDRPSRTGWSVLICGSAREIDAKTANPKLVGAVRAAAPDAWAPGSRDHLVRVVADSITGRRIRHIEPSSAPGTSEPS